MMKSRLARRAEGLFALVLAGFLTAAPARAVDPENGLKIARIWCAQCHRVERGGTTVDVVPSFVEMSDPELFSDNRLRGWLIRHHPPMPPVPLSGWEIDAIISYIRTLAQP